MPVTELDRVVEKLSSIDNIVHNPARLMILFALIQTSPIDYLRLMSLTGLSWGNISTHLSKLEDAGYINIVKSFIGKKPHTSIKLTTKGRNAYLKWGFTIVSAVPEIAIRSLSVIEPLPIFPDTGRKSAAMYDFLNQAQIPERFFIPVYHTWSFELPPFPQYN